MKRRKRIGCDADGVAIDFLSQARRVYLRMFGSPMPEFHEWDFASVLPKGRANEFWAELGAERLHRSMLPYPGTYEALMRLNAVADVYIVTSPLRSDPHWMQDRIDWLNYRLEVHPNRVQFQHDKHTFAGDMLIDDKPENVAAWAEEHEAGTAVCWAQSYNDRHDFGPLRHRVVRTNDWSTILRLAGG